ANPINRSHAVPIILDDLHTILVLLVPVLVLLFAVLIRKASPLLRILLVTLSLQPLPLARPKIRRSKRPKPSLEKSPKNIFGPRPLIQPCPPLSRFSIPRNRVGRPLPLSQRDGHCVAFRERWLFLVLQALFSRKYGNEIRRGW